MNFRSKTIGGLSLWGWLLVPCIWSGESMAGILAAGGGNWGQFSLRPEEEEATPNYQGIGPALDLGYSLQQTFDVGFTSSYYPGSKGAYKPGRENASLLTYGGRLGWRLFNAVLVSAQFGHGIYHLVLPNRLDEVYGKWRGPTGGLRIAALSPSTKERGWQIFFELVHGLLVSQTDPRKEKRPKRRFDLLTFGVQYEFNSKETWLIDKAIWNL